MSKLFQIAKNLTNLFPKQQAKCNRCDRVTTKTIQTKAEIWFACDCTHGLLPFQFKQFVKPTKTNVVSTD